MSFITVDKQICKRDLACVAVCPMGLLVKDEDGYPTGVENAERECLECGHCVSVCPYGGLTLPQMDPKSCTALKPELDIAPEQAEQFLKKRRSIRSYKKKAVPREILAKVVDCARWAPTAKNGQPVHWLIFEKREDVHELAALTIEAMRQHDFFQEMVEAWEKGEDMVLRGSPHLIVAHAHESSLNPIVDCTIAISYMELLATAHGLGTCWAGIFMFAAESYPPLIEKLALPEGHKVYTAMMIGYPKFKYHRLPCRKEAPIAWR